MTESILDTIKRPLQVELDYDGFDSELIMHINSVFLPLKQLGIGPDEGFTISGKEETWSQLLGTDKRLEAVKTYVYLKVRLLFDPPSNSFVTDAITRQIAELESRLCMEAEPPEETSTPI